MRPEHSGWWIIHMLDPKAIIECIPEHTRPKDDRIFKCYEFDHIDGATEEWTLIIYHFFTTDPLEKPQDRVPQLLDRAWRWFRSYLELREGEEINVADDE